ncbi:unnamed protein product [Vitrella brassicaformis CCMP3155]|uniref:Uncharacterized protein n=1 Tax=Vitrella brassicaformis (strain CCMP3155) TaxID=1169540 RepID=A0A0G4GJ38_VITBC|nr:unnamed protein product [Vitrella brassicaformis CCMP3155]|eukprot:CEM29841.1 unnamed protein product [Vitrella brassicaformis CCMP3155]
MDGDKILCRKTVWSSRPSLLISSSPVFPNSFDPADRPTQLDSEVHPTYTSMVAFVLFDWLRGLLVRGDDSTTRWIKNGWSFSPASFGHRRARELLAAPHSDASQWGPGVAVFEKSWAGRWRWQLVVLGSEVMGGANTAVIYFVDFRAGKGMFVKVYTTESVPHDRTRNAVMRVLGRQLGGKVWRMEHESRLDDSVASWDLLRGYRSRCILPSSL